MKVYLIRHGIAGDRAHYATDEERPLTEKGHQKTKEVAERLAEIGLKFDLILTSPLVRAKQTAEILQQAKLASQVEEFAPLAPDGNIQDWLSWLTKWRQERENRTIALVGHQPDLGNWAEMLIWGETREKLVVKKAGAIAIKLPKSSSPIGNSELLLLTSPKWLL